MDAQLMECGLEQIDLFLLNEIEGRMLSGQSEPEKILDTLLTRYPRAKVVLTLGEQGAWYASGTQRIYQGSFACTVVDTTAAGDTFTGYFLAAYLSGNTPQESMRRGAKAASLAIGKQGAAASIPLKQDVDAAL